MFFRTFSAALVDHSDYVLSVKLASQALEGQSLFTGAFGCHSGKGVYQNTEVVLFFCNLNLYWVSYMERFYDKEKSSLPFPSQQLLIRE